MLNAFSDGNPVYEFSVFLLLFGLSCIAATFPTIRQFADEKIRAAARFARHRRALPEHGLVSDLRKIDIARILTGGIALLRYSDILVINMSTGNGKAILLSGFATLCAALVTVGLFTPIAAFLLMATANLIVDNMLGASTLGTMVMSMLLLLFILAPAGRTLAMDSWLSRRGGAGQWLVGKLYQLSGPLSTDRLLAAKLAAILAYYCVCLYSVIWHLNDDAWMSGLVIAWIMLSDASNPYYADLMWQAYGISPWLFVNFARLSILGMFAWYVLVLPGLFLGWVSRWFVILWGLAFFLISTFVLPLSYLGWYELVFWFALFATGPAFGSAAGPAVAVLFDAGGRPARVVARLLARLDLFDRLEFRSQKAGDGLTGIDLGTGSANRGAGFWNLVAGKVVLLWVAKPFLWLWAKLAGASPDAPPANVSAVVAMHRIEAADTSNGGHSIAVLGVYGAFVILAAAFLVRLPLDGPYDSTGVLSDGSKFVFGAAPSAFGIHQINVFNAADLSVFTYKKAMFFPEEGFDLSSEKRAHEHLKRVTYEYYRPSDAQRYGMVGYGRRMARTNIGCNRAYWSEIMPFMQLSFVTPPGREPVTDVIYDIELQAWPSASDLNAYAPLKRGNVPFCRAWLDIKNGVVRDFRFVQPGVDEALRRRDYPHAISAQRVEAALGYPCAAARRFTKMLAAYRLDLYDDEEAREAVRNFAADIYGRFEVDCLKEAGSIAGRWPAIMDTSMMPANPALCEAGIALVTALAEADPHSARLKELVTPAAESAVAARESGDFESCTENAILGWRTYGHYLSERGGL